MFMATAKTYTIGILALLFAAVIVPDVMAGSVLKAGWFR